MTPDSPEWGLPKHLTNKQTNTYQEQRPQTSGRESFDGGRGIFSSDLHGDTLELVEVDSRGDGAIEQFAIVLLLWHVNFTSMEMGSDDFYVFHSIIYLG